MAAATALALASVGAAIYGAVKKPKAEAAPAPPPLLPAPDPADDSKAVNAALTKRRRQATLIGSGGTKSGRAATLLTGASGLTTPAPTERKTLLGG